MINSSSVTVDLLAKWLNKNPIAAEELAIKISTKNSKVSREDLIDAFSLDESFGIYSFANASYDNTEMPKMI